MTQGMVFGNRAKTVCLCAMLLFAVASPGSADTVVRFQTALGDFDVQLYDSIAPNTVQNFLTYVNDGDYVNSFFHRLAPGFVLQGGGFTFDANVGIEDPWPTVPADAPVVNEFNVSNTRGTIAMAKVGAQYDENNNLIPGTGPDSATSQFFFNLGDNSANLDNQNGGFTAFGEVIGNGMAVVDLLATQQVWNGTFYDGAFGDLPLINYSGSEPWTQTLEMFDVGFLPGDVDCNGLVSEADLSIITNNWGQSGPGRAEGDLNNNGIVDGSDYTEVLSFWNTGTPLEPPAEAIPEPGTLGLLMVIAGLALLRQRK